MPPPTKECASFYRSIPAALLATLFSLRRSFLLLRLFSESYEYCFLEKVSRKVPRKVLHSPHMDLALDIPVVNHRTAPPRMDLLLDMSGVNHGVELPLEFSVKLLLFFLQGVVPVSASPIAPQELKTIFRRGGVCLPFVLPRRPR